MAAAASGASARSVRSALTRVAIANTSEVPAQRPSRKSSTATAMSVSVIVATLRHCTVRYHRPLGPGARRRA